MLNKATIKAEIITAFNTVMNQTENRDDAIARVADRLADAVINAIKSAKVSYQGGLTAPAGGGPVTGTIEHEIQ